MPKSNSPKQRLSAQKNAATHSRSLRCERLEDRRLLAVVTVDTDQDIVDLDDGVTSLREAIFATNTVPGADEIVFDFGHDGPATILLTEGELKITDSLRISGPGAELLTIDGSENSRPGRIGRIFSRAFTIEDFDGSSSSNVALTGFSITRSQDSHGGAIFARENLTIKDVMIDGSTSAGGGGIYFTTQVLGGRSGGGHTSPVTLKIDRSTVSDNSSFGPGGGLLARGDVTVEIVDSVFSDNRTTESRSPGGGIANYEGDLTIINSTIDGNKTTGSRSNGGGISSYEGNLTIIGSTISNNSTTSSSSYSDGGGVFAANGRVEIVSSLIANNSVDRGNSWGGGLRFRGSDSDSSFTLTKSTVSGNSSPVFGGGLQLRGYNIEVTDSTINNNFAGFAGGGISFVGSNKLSKLQNLTISGNRSNGLGGGVHSDRGDLLIAHSTIAFNESDSDFSGEGSGGGVYVRTAGTLLDHTIVAGNVDHSGVANDVAGVIDSRRSLIGIGADTLAPLANYGGSTLTHALIPGSPAINAGDSALVAGVDGVPEFDQRVAQFGRVIGPRIDIGAYEDQRLVGDFNQNKQVDVHDLIRWERFFRPDHLNGADFLNWQRTYGISLAFEQPSSAEVHENLSESLYTSENIAALHEDDHGPVVVTTDQDIVDFNDGVISLREAIFATNTVPGADEIVFDFGHDGPATILLTEGELEITDSLTITGSGAELLTIDASGNDPTPDEDNGDGSRVFNIDDGFRSVNIDVAISGMKLSGGDTGGEGGAIAFRENLVLESVWITDNVAIRGGGVASIRPFPQLAEPGLLQVVDSTISGNHASTGVGGRDPFGGYGGAIFSNGFLRTQINHSTISGNSARHLTLDLYGDAAISYTTVANNIGGGIDNGFNTNLSIHSSIIAGNSSIFSPADLSSRGEIDATNSLIGKIGRSNLSEVSVSPQDANGNIIGGPINGPIDPLLAPLADNGGPTLTHALLPGSPAINAGDLNAVAGVDDVPLYDQRGKGFDRIVSRIDIGAFEVQELGDMNLLVDTLEDESDGDYSRGDLSLREAIELANANPVPDTIRFDESLAGGTILLTQGELEITDSIYIQGLGAELLTIDASGNDPTPDEDNGDGSRVFNINDGDASMLIDVEISGLTLTGGDASSGGGAIRSTENLRLDYSTIADNSTSGDHADGGGIFNDQGKLTIVGTTIENNSTRGRDSNGGGVSSRSGYFTLSYSVVSDNVSLDGSGGGIFSSLNNLSLNNSSIRRNSTMGGNDRGGGIFSNGDSATFNHISITDNSTYGTFASGGGIYSRYSNLDIASSTISSNSSNGMRSNGGGLMYVALNLGARIADTLANRLVLDDLDSAQLIIRDSAISDNHSGLNGGGLHVVGADSREGYNVFHLLNSTVSNNTTINHGGGVFIDTPDKSNHISHSTIAFNTSDADESGEGSGGGIFVEDGGVLLSHTIVAGNVDHSGVAPDVAGNVVSGYSLVSDNFGSNLVEAPLNFPDGNGNLIGGPIHGVIDPLLGPLRGPHRSARTAHHTLASDSPAVDAGNPLLRAGVNGVPMYDQLHGTSRVKGTRIDIGAIEKGGVPIIVDTLIDELDGDLSRGDVSLRDAIELANREGLRIIRFDEKLAGGTVVLTMGELTVLDNLFVGSGGDFHITIDASGNDPTPNTKNGDGSRIFHASESPGFSGGAFTLENLILTGADSSGDGGAIYSTVDTRVINSHLHGNAAKSGGAIWASDDLRIDTSLFTNNYAQQEGGAVSTSGKLFVLNSQLLNNVTDGSGGGIAAAENSTLTIFSTTLANNKAALLGGAISSIAEETVIASSTLSGNTASHGGAAWLNGLSNLSSTTITDNIALGGVSVGGDVPVGGVVTVGPLRMENSIIAMNVGAIADLHTKHAGNAAEDVVIEFSFIGDNRGTDLDETSPGLQDSNSNFVGGEINGPINPMLTALQDNGGTQFLDGTSILTRLPIPGSLAIDTGPLDLVISSNDQRGAPYRRPFPRRMDMGSVELNQLIVDTLSDEINFKFDPGDLSIREALRFIDPRTPTDTIYFHPKLSGGTIELWRGELKIADSVRIVGLGSESLTIDANFGDPTPDENNGDGTRIFNVDDGDASTMIDVEISGLTLTGGDVFSGGGAIRSTENLRVADSHFLENSTSGDHSHGGGILNDQGKLTLFFTIIEGNSTSGDFSGGGGIASLSGDATIRYSVIIGNTTSGRNADGGGAFFQNGTLKTFAMIIGGNSTNGVGSSGGGIHGFSSDIELDFSSVRSNTTSGRSSGGGGIASVFGSLNVAGTRIANNHTTGTYSAGGGIYSSGALRNYPEM